MTDIADIEDADEIELRDVAIHVSALRPIQGRGNVRYALDVHIETPTLFVEVRNCSIRQESSGVLKFHLPTTRDFKSGATEAAVAISTGLLTHIAELALELVTGQVPGRIMRLPL